MDIETLQAVLKHFGYYKERVDGIKNRELDIALRQFKKDANLLSLGELDEKTLQKLNKLKEQWELDESLAYTE